MTEQPTSRERNAELRLAWDMAHAEAPLRNAIKRLKQSSWETSGSIYTQEGKSSRVENLLQEALRRSSEVERAYHDKVANQDEDYLAIETMYEGITLNKEDLYVFLTSKTASEKELKKAEQLTTRVWNLLGEVSSTPNSDILFGRTIPTGKQKPGYMHGRNSVGSEIVEYKDLDLASLVHFLDTVNELTEHGRGTARGIGGVSLKAMTEFADYQTQEVVSSRRKDYIRI